MSYYKPYPAYKDSGVEWLGEVPEHWNVLPIKRVAKLRNLRTNECESGVDYIGLEDVESGSGKHSPTEGNSRLSEDSTVGVFSSGDVLYGKLRPYLKKAIVADTDGVCSTEFLILSSNKIESALLQKLLLTSEVTQQIESTCEGAKMPRADWEGIGLIPIPVPPNGEQECLVKEMNAAIARIDTLIQKKTRFIEILKEKRQAKITHAVTKGLNTNVITKDSGVEWIGEIPEHWEVTKLKYIASFFGGGTPAKDKQDYWNGDIPWISPKDMKFESITDSIDHITSEGLANSATKLVEAGAVLLVARSGILRHTIPVGINDVPVSLNQDMKALVLDEARVRPRFMFRWVQGLNSSLRDVWAKQGATVESLEHEYVANAPLPLPSLDEQDVILSKLDRDTARIDTLISKTQRSINLLKERRSAFITAAVTGQIDLRGEQ